MVRIFLNETVYEAALRRIRWLFSEFPTVGVWMSGGKDSTVVLELAIIVARELNRLPLTVAFIDQELEYEGTIEYVRRLSLRQHEINLRWYQVPLRLTNASSRFETFLHCWEPNKQWMRPKEPNAITENVYDTNRFYLLFNRILAVEYPKQKAAFLGGLRTEESPMRKLACLHAPTYKGETWGKKLNPNWHYTFYPIYDWGITDVWKAIHQNRWDYNEVYIKQFQIGLPLRGLRVSSLTHETALKTLWILQEIEPENYERMTARLAGIDMSLKFGRSDFQPRELPPMFGSWKEYRDYLLEHLVLDSFIREELKYQFDKDEKEYELFMDDPTHLHKSQVKSILTNDYEGIKLGLRKTMDLWKIKLKRRAYLREQQKISDTTG